MTQLEGCIRFWRAKLAKEAYLIDTSTVTLVESTIKYLEELQRLKEPSRGKDKQNAG